MASIDDSQPVSDTNPDPIRDIRSGVGDKLDGSIASAAQEYWKEDKVWYNKKIWEVDSTQLKPGGKSWEVVIKPAMGSGGLKTVDSDDIKEIYVRGPNHGKK